MKTEPSEVAAHRAWAILDTRPRAERFGDLGFIPGSRWFPEDRLRADPFVLTDEIPPGRVIVLACLTGRRSAALVPFVSALGYPDVRSLEGGLLAWASAYPVCGADPGEASSAPSADALTPEKLQRLIASCFVAESVENALSRGLEADDFDPKAEVKAVVERAFDRHPSEKDALVEVVERLAELARRRGHRLETIAANVDRLLGLIGRLGP